MSPSVRAVFSVLVLASLAACERGPDGAGREAVVEPRTGGTLVIAAGNDLSVPNGLVAPDNFTQEVNRYLLYTTLVRYDDALGYEPYLAESWELEGDTAVVFRLRSDLRWHDGRPTTAHDVAFTLERASDPATAYPLSHLLAGWGEAEVVDSFTVRFGSTPQSEPLAGFAELSIMPRHLLGSVPPEQIRSAEFNRQPVGNGPFRFVSRTANDRWVFEANEDFPSELGGRPYLDRLVWRVVPDQSAQVTELITGGADIILAPAPDRFEELRARPGIRGLVKPSPKFAFLGWNGRRPPFDDARVRRALAMATDRSEMVQVLRAGYGAPVAAPFAPSHWAYAEDVQPLPHSPDSARALLAAAGIVNRDGDALLELPDGEEFRFELLMAGGSDFNRNMAQMVQADLADVGVDVRLRPQEFGTLVQRISSPEREFSAVLMGWEATLKPDLGVLFHSREQEGPFQLASYSNPEVDSLLDRAERTPERARAEPLWHRVQEVLREDQPWTVLYFYPDLVLLRERVRGVEMDLRGVLTGVRSWWLEDPRADEVPRGADTGAANAPPRAY